MRIDTIDNGNVALDNISNISQNNRNSLSGNTTDNYRHTNSIDTTRFVSNNFIDNENCNTDNIYELKSDSKIYNRQYNLNNNANLTASLNATNLDKDLQTKTKWQDAVAAPKYSLKSPLVGEERGFDNSDSDEMSENSVHHVPRGIVNPNYPGFQHLAHTLQDYSSNIEQFYHSDNDMTDDDLDIEITPEATFDINEKIDEYINNNNENDSSVSNNPFISDSPKQSSNTQNIPDLLKTVTFNNNNDSVQYEFNNCSTTDIENNFRAKDIIGDFNKEVEDEIRQLLNYNINIEDDLEELRRDIKDTFAKPIENTLNNISDVVNHVIKKLVESDECDRSDASTPDIIIDHEMEDISNMNRENETNSRTELSISRPTFLLIESNKDIIIRDALLSDGKEEININVDEYDTEHLSHNVENTIKQLSTELRKIIPKLNEMRDRDKLWIDNKKEKSVVTDGNSNTVVTSSSVSTSDAISSQNRSGSNGRKIHNMSTINQRSVRSHIESKLRQNVKKTLPKGPKNLSVRKNENHNESDLECFDVYNIETALPKLDLDAIESHIKAAKEAERRKRNDREEIRKRLAMGGDTEDYYSLGHTDRPGKKPSLHSRLQNGKNLQICFMNETASDNESQASDLEHSFCNSKNSSRSSIFSKNSYNHPYQTRPLSVNITKHEKSNPPSGAKLRPTSLMLKTSKSRSTHSLGHIELKESDFYALQATLQTEARIALAQAKEMARIQMERERRSRPVSPVTEMLRRSMEKANAPLAADRRRVSRHLLTDMNIAQLQVIVNELHSQIESLNDTLVKLLMARDELHMGQDSMLVDIEDLTRYLGVREQTKKTKGNQKSGVKRFTSLVHK